MNTGPEEPANLDPEGRPAPSTDRPAGPTAPGDVGGHGGLLRRALVRAFDRLAGVGTLRGEAGEPHREAEHGLDAYSDTDAYRAWLSDQAGVGSETSDRHSARAGGDGSPAHPMISVIVPVFRPELWYLQRCVDSVKNQRYDKWELCLCDDASGVVEVERFLTDAAASDPRVKVAVRDANGGISRASNTALALAGGDFVALLDHDDELAPDALALVARSIVEEPEADVVYSDEDKIDHDGRPCFPTFKPDWSPDLLLSYPYLGHLLVVRRRLVEEIGGFRPEMDGSQDFDLMLRATERARAVVHIPKVLYHWRMVEGSAAGNPDAKPWAYDASRRALADALVRRGIHGHVEPGPFPGAYHTRRAVETAPRVSIVIPLRGQAPMLRACVDSLRVDSGHEAFEVVLVDNEGVEPEARAVADALAQRPEIRVVESPRPVQLVGHEQCRRPHLRRGHAALPRRRRRRQRGRLDDGADRTGATPRGRGRGMSPAVSGRHARARRRGAGHARPDGIPDAGDARGRGRATWDGPASSGSAVP